jgi:hypothetical protein
VSGLGLAASWLAVEQSDTESIDSAWRSPCFLSCPGRGAAPADPPATAHHRRSGRIINNYRR